MPRHQVGGYLESKSHILAGSDHVAVAHESGQCVGLVAASDLVAGDRPFTYIETLLVAERHHGTEVATTLVATLFAGIVRRLGAFPDLVAMKTYTPKAYVLMRRIADDATIGFYPDIDGGNSEQDRRLAAGLAAVLSPDCEFRPGTGVIRGGGGPITSEFWADQPLSNDAATNRFFSREVGLVDRVLCIVRAESPGARRILMNRLRVSPPNGT